MHPSDHQRAISGNRPRAGLGRLGLVSINTWLIVVNIVVFVLNNVVLSQHAWPVHAGTYFSPGASPEQIARARIDRQHAQLADDGTYHCPIFDPLGVTTDLLGRPTFVQIGFERFRPQPIIEAFGHFSTSKFWAEGQVWRLITFQFLHANTSHIVLNMLGLLFFGGLVEEYLGRRRYLAFYLLSGVCGALAYLLLNLAAYSMLHAGVNVRLPFLLFDDPYTPLVGASAGVFGVLMAAAFIAPTAIVDLLFILPMSLRTAVYIFLALAIFNLYIGGRNAGGDAAHVGGAIAGAMLVRRPYILRDFATCFGLLGSGESARSTRKQSGANRAPADAADIDRIIRKAVEEGTESLTAAERAAIKRVAAADEP
ncbi:MAG: rhomboid family intramembrane serine protease [Phycisphaerales bacterium]|nr:rhomboid family intramembrane serine protease [Phycisphaerales bacterium]